MIRYVIAVVLLVAILGLSLPAIDQVAGDRSESQVRAIATTIEEQALELQRTEEPPPDGVRGPQRVFDAKFPGKGIASKPVTTFEMVPHRDDNLTVLTYRIEGRSRERIVIETVIVNEAGNPVRLSSPTGEGTYRLRLARSSDDEPVVVFSRDVTNDPGEDWNP